MTIPSDKPPPVTWKTISRVADEANAADAADISALSSLSDADLDAQLAAAAVVLCLLFWKRDDVVAFFAPHQEPIGPDREGPPRGPTPMQLEQARLLRSQALGDCEDEFWPECEDKLDRASKIDPAGETAPDVQAARKALADVKRAPPAPSGGRLKP